MKSSASIGLFIFAFGAFIGNNFKGSGKKTEAPAISQEQTQQQAQNHGQSAQNGCVAEVGKKTNPDGSIEEFFRFRASQGVSQAASSDQSAAQSQKIGADESKIDVFAGGGLSSSIHGWGAVEVISGRHSVEYLTNGPEYIGLYKFKILSF